MLLLLINDDYLFVYYYLLTFYYRLLFDLILILVWLDLFLDFEGDCGLLFVLIVSNLMIYCG